MTIVDFRYFYDVHYRNLDNFTHKCFEIIINLLLLYALFNNKY